MVTFKDQLNSDISVFLNSNEFGETHNINDENIVIVQNNDILAQKNNQEGIYSGEIAFLIATNQINFGIPTDNGPDVIIQYDNKSYKVMSVDNPGFGMSTVILSSNTGLRFIQVKYRSKAGSGGIPDYGVPGTKQNWSDASIINPNPVIEEIKQDYIIKDFGTISQGSIKLKIDKANYSKSDLLSYEYLINNNEFSIIGGQIFEETYFYSLYLCMK